MLKNIETPKKMQRNCFRLFFKCKYQRVDLQNAQYTTCEPVSEKWLKEVIGLV